NLFRHSEATQTAQFMTEAQMRKRHGWTPYSKMPGRYVHLVNADVERAVLAHHGIVPDDKPIVPTPKRCHICDTLNSTESTICTKCGKPLDMQSALEIDKIHESEKLELEKRLSEINQVKELLNTTNERLKSQEGTQKMLESMLYSILGDKKMIRISDDGKVTLEPITV
ncbi:MAG TPA: hypothetical protein VFA69_01855, partial [Candidatus Nitrosotalea sp.]|nr:hypothetical protein [Candidatus Nitrosotalea sp.]